MIQFQALKKAGSRRNGYERDTGAIYHAVPRQSFTALCGVSPRADWGAWPADTVTCPKCQKKLQEQPNGYILSFE